MDPFKRSVGRSTSLLRAAYVLVEVLCQWFVASLGAPGGGTHPPESVVLGWLVLARTDVPAGGKQCCPKTCAGGS